MELLAPWSLAALVAVPAVLLWGLWAPRGRRTVVASLLLWQRALGTGPAGRPSARVRLRNPLLWLDAAALLFLVLAAARPATRGTLPAEPVATLLVDRTASMRTDSGDGPRWRRSLAMTEPILKELGRAPVRVVSVPGDAGTVATEVLPAADVRARAADFWRPVQAADDVWRAVGWQASQAPQGPAIVATDLAPAQEPGRGVYVLATGGRSRDVGLVRAATRIEGDRWWLLVAVRAAAEGAAPCGLEVATPAGQVLVRQPRVGQPGETAECVIPMPGPPPLAVRVALTDKDGRTPLGDGFAADDAADLARRAAGPVRIVLVGEPDAALERALAACDDAVPVRAADAATVGPGDADLVVAVAAALPAGWKGPAALVMPPAGAGPVAPLAEQAPPEWTVATTHPLADALYLEPPRVGPVRRYRLEAGAEVLLGTRDAPLAVTWQADGARRLAVLFPFDIETTDWTRRAGFPIFWQRAVDWLVPPALRPGGGGHVAAAPSGEAAGGTAAASLLGTDEGFQAGPGRDDSAAALRAVRAAMAGRRARSLSEWWPWLALAAVAVLVVRAWVAR